MITHFETRREPVKTEPDPTEQIMSRIKAAPGTFADRELDSIRSSRFTEYLRELMEKYDCSPAQLIIRTNMSKPFVYQILEGKRTPGRDMILRICLAIRTDTEEAQRLLTLGEKGILYPKVKRDAAILCCMEAKKSLENTNNFLRDHGEKELL